MPTGSSAIVQKLWNYCNVLRDDGLSYGDYVEQLTYLLFLRWPTSKRNPRGRADRQCLPSTTGPVSSLAMVMRWKHTIAPPWRSSVASRGVLASYSASP